MVGVWEEVEPADFIGFQHGRRGEMTDPDQQSKKDDSIPAIAHVLCGWPLVMIAFGGAIGGGLGGAAYGVNLGIYKSELPGPVKAILIVLSGCAAIGIWFMIAMSMG